MGSPSKPDVTLSLTLSHSSACAQSLKAEERGIRLIKLLLECANHASSGNLHRADASLREITQLSSVTGDSMQRLATRFSSALAIRIVKCRPGIYKALNQAHKPILEFEKARSLFVRTFPYLGFAYTIIARTLCHAMASEPAIHIVDLGSGDLKLWVPLLRSLAHLSLGTPRLRVTCVSSNKIALENLGRRLLKEAETLDMPFQFNPLTVSLRDLTKDMLKVRSGEALAFISVLNLHILLAEDDQVEAHFGVSNKSNGIKDCTQMTDFLAMARSVSPKIVFLVEQEANHNSNRLAERFVEGLHYYSAVFDSIDAALGATDREERIVLEEMFGREIENIVACEGLERFERHERYGRWMIRLTKAGFKPVRLWYNSDEDGKQMVDAFGKDGYKIIAERSSLMICWHERPLYSVTAWIC
ncbi:hypothetical protein K2173_025953 [Erythroxylum novogranatense]|uniref:Scarecrow-like protein 3 n=1 Tax=Erythroxylum novogranatense TaxID=1862640 RepID=A0AAV8SIF6_9ROSI|nr:hypothetical protein K2173_025953 [Erythroxylum novogranatense]